MFTDTNLNIARQGKKRKHQIVGTAIHSSKGKVIGQVIGNVYVKDIKNAHILEKYHSVASDVCSLHEAEHAGAEFVEWTNIDDGVIYRASISKFWELGRFFNFGHGDQQMLGLKHFEHRRDPNFAIHPDVREHSEPTITNDDAVKPLDVESRAVVGVKFKKGKRTPKQLGLFGGRE